ncbi:MAG: methyltransferase domain-containing protein [Polymorphobacter sp.]|uniref:methyltransferase domain-containing protein n=1 Tax=Polymorphobacter sp. TaxID=1909290 RepID=UPI003A89B614
MLAGPVLAQDQMPAAGRAETMPAVGRPVAKIVSPAWDREQRRDQRGEFADVVKALGIGPGQTVADIGAGAGYYTVRLSPLVGPQGRVIAQDIEARYIQDLRKRVAAEKLENVRFVRGTESDPKLPVGAVDVALMIHMYHEIGQPYALLSRLRASLKPGGRVAIVDLEREPQYHGMPRDLLVCEVRAVGYELEKLTDLEVGYLAVFRLGAPVDAAKVKACRG